ncbi:MULTISPECIES: hypothetical protein [Paenibacillus]|uniref:hypothetical protein n=1 Tax=Paenibacillus TaxID=44249 RepID=UPI0022B93BD3|nr:hypothetical protein [Paenibacillus caseinilyticus]MCZ8524012.1 hypothetical protein [Paenibacillus caseinilyticus]
MEWTMDWPALLMLLGMTSLVLAPWLLAGGQPLPAGGGRAAANASLPLPREEGILPAPRRRRFAVRLLRPPRTGSGEGEEAR